MPNLDIHELEWDHVNEAHILATHGLTRADIEAVCFGDPAYICVEDTHSGRYRVMGPRHDGKILVVILNPKGGSRFYPVTAKQPKRQELRRYNEWRAKKGD